VGANIAEGSARYGSREFKRFLNIALGSLGEVENHLRLALDLELLDKSDFERLARLANEAGKLTGLLARSLE
jgi:four helix bundle protein